MQRYGVPSSLDSGVRYAMMFEELADGVRTVDFKAVGFAAELLQQAKIMECGADKQDLHINSFPCLPAKLFCPEEDAVRVVEEQRCAELSEKSGSLASQLTIRDSRLYVLKLRRWCWYRKNHLGPPKRPPCLHRLTEGGRTQLAAGCNSTNYGRSRFQKRTSIHLLSPKWLSPVAECRTRRACGSQ